MQIPKREYWRLTPAETYAIIRGWNYNREIMSANFRPIFAALFNQHAERSKQKTARELWPLSIDGHTEEDESIEQTYERNKRLIEALTKN